MLRAPAQAAEARVGHLRTRKGDYDVDLALIRGDGKEVAVEVKLAGTVDGRDTRRLHRLARQTGADLLDALVVDTGPRATGDPTGSAWYPSGSSPRDLPRPVETCR